MLFDEVPNFVNRYRQMADPFHAFIQNLTVAMTGTTHRAALTLVVMDPGVEWTGATDDDVRQRIGEWTRARGASPRLYPGALVWAVKKPGRELRDRVEQWLAWKPVASEISAGTLGSELDSTDLADIRAKVREAGDVAREQIWGDYRFVVIADGSEPDGLKVSTLARVIPAAPRASADGSSPRSSRAPSSTNQSVPGTSDGTGRPHSKEDGVWPLVSLRQSFLDGWPRGWPSG